MLHTVMVVHDVACVAGTDRWPRIEMLPTLRPPGSWWITCLSETGRRAYAPSSRNGNPCGRTARRKLTSDGVRAGSRLFHRWVHRQRETASCSVAAMDALGLCTTFLIEGFGVDKQEMGTNDVNTQLYIYKGFVPVLIESSFTVVE